MFDVPEHPDVARMLAEGVPHGNTGDNQNNEDARFEFALEHAKEFILFALAGDPEVLNHFAEDSSTGYRDWLN